MYETRCNVVKTKLTDSEYKKFKQVLEKSGARNASEFLRERILLSDRQIAKRDRIAGKIGQEQLQEQLCIISDMSSVINQYRAGVDEKLAIDKIEEGVRKLCQLQRS